LGNVTALVCDLDGVVYLDRDGVPGAGEALQAMADRGIRLMFVTNNSTKAPETVIEHIAERTGFVGDVDLVVTSGLATAHAMQGRVTTAFVVGGDGLVATLAASGIEVVADWRAAQAVVVGLDRDLSYGKLTDATLAIRNGASFYATNADATYPTPQGLYPGGGAIVAALETATDVRPIVCGKPHEPTRELIRELAGGGDVAVVGDRPETDLALGKAEGWPAILVLTGVVDDPSDVPAAYQPDVVLASIADLPALLGA
jgi:4-nitrophenyl phosphatase